MKKCLILSLSLSFFANAQPAGRKQIEAFYDGLSMAADIKFAEGMVSHRSPDFSGKDERGFPRSTWGDLDRFRRLFSESVWVHCRSKIIKFSQEDGVARCTVEQQWRYSKKEVAPLPKLRVVQEKWVLEDSWELNSGAWRLVSSQLKQRSVPEW